jgi:hypothetical protein
MELPAHRSGDRRPSGDRESGTIGQPPPNLLTFWTSWVQMRPKMFAGSDANPAKTFPGSAAACHRQGGIILSMSLAPTSFHPVVET